MAELFRIDSSGKLQNVEREDFSDEIVDLEDFIVKNSKILGNVVVLDHQIRTGTKEGIVDILALDTEGQGQVVVVELKNIHADEYVIPQVLRYARWVKNNPDFVLGRIREKRAELEQKNINLEKIDTNPRIILVAPSFESELIKMSEDIGYAVDFLAISRYKMGNETFVVTDLEELEEHEVTTTRPREVWDWNHYKTKLEQPDAKLEAGRALEERINQFLTGKAWDLKKEVRKWAVVWRRGFFSAWWIELGYYANECVLIFKLQERPDAAAVGLTEADLMEWGEHGWAVKVPSKDFEIARFAPLFAKAYEFVGGK